MPPLALRRVKWWSRKVFPHSRRRSEVVAVAVALLTIQTGPSAVFATGEPAGVSLANPRHPGEQLAKVSTSRCDFEKTQSNTQRLKSCSRLLKIWLTNNLYLGRREVPKQVLL